MCTITTRSTDLADLRHSPRRDVNRSVPAVQEVEGPFVKDMPECPGSSKERLAAVEDTVGGNTMGERQSDQFENAVDVSCDA